MTAYPQRSNRGNLMALHPAFALTGILHAIGGSLLPSIAASFHLNDSQSGSLFLFYFVGTSMGALFCVRRYAGTIAVGFVVASGACVAIVHAGSALLQPLFLILGIGVGIPMTAISMFVGSKFASRTAAPLTLLNFSWSAGALIAPLLAARMLAGHTYKTAYLVLACASAAAAVACWLVLQDSPENPSFELRAGGHSNLRLIILFALLTFLEVGVENTTATWLATYTMRSLGIGAATAAASTSLYWCGFLASRGLSSLLLLRVPSMRVLCTTIGCAIASAALLITVPSPAWHDLAMLILGAALAPIFPLLLSQFFARARRSSDARWVLAICGVGGSAVPWLTGFVSTRFSSLRLGLLTVPTALLFMLCMLPALIESRSAPSVEEVS